MRMRNELWQGYFGYWQNQFIHQNILTIGYTAWNGYLNHGRGIVVCQVIDTISPCIDWSVDPITFDQRFVPQTQVEQYLQAFELQNDVVIALLNTIAIYDPNQAVVLLIIGNGGVDINLLQNLKVSPIDCYAQVQHRWAEFQPDLTSHRRHS